jgi:hypothetical protein
MNLPSQFNKPPLSQQSCSNCNAFAPNPAANPPSGQPRQGWCRAMPPQMDPIKAGFQASESSAMSKIIDVAKQKLAALAAKGVEYPHDIAQLEALDFRFGSGGPSDLRNELGNNPLGSVIAKAGLPKDRFGIQASTDMLVPAGCWRLRTVSDDGIRVRIDGKTVIDRWNWHPPTADTYEFTLEKEATVKVEVDFFEIDGNACLSLFLDPCRPVEVQK